MKRELWLYSVLGRAVVIVMVILILLVFTDKHITTVPLLLYKPYKVNLFRLKSTLGAFFINICQWTEVFQHYLWIYGVMKWFYFGSSAKNIKNNVLCWKSHGITRIWILILNLILVWLGQVTCEPHVPQVQNGDDIYSYKD